MYRHFDNPGRRQDFPQSSAAGLAVARSGDLDALVRLESIGARLSIARNQAIYREGDTADCWYKVVSGAVRLCKLLADGRRYIAEFCFGGDSFGLDDTPVRHFSAEAVSDVVVMRLPRRMTETLMDRDPAVARRLREAMLRDLANAHGRMMLLGRMTAPERVAAFLLETAERRDAARSLDLPMSRNDIADYLGLTPETVCRVLSSFKSAGMIATPNAHRVELRDRGALEALAGG